jgi:hypothetical protein
MNPLTPESSPLSASAAEISAGSRITRIGEIAEMKSQPASGSHLPPRMPRSTVLAEMVGKLLGLVAGVLNPSFVERSLAWARSVGHYAVLGGASLTLLYAIYAAIKTNSFAVFLAGLGMIAALSVAQFAATRFLDAADNAIANTPSRVSSRAFLECSGLLVLLFGVALLVGGVIAAIQLSSFAALLPSLLGTAALVYFGAVALHPGLVNVATVDGSAGEEAIGLLSFFFKAGLKLVPLFFGLLAVGGCLAIAASFFPAGQNLANVIGSITSGLPLPVNTSGGLGGATVVLFACLLPLICYFIFLLEYLFLDVLRAVLCVPAKLDALRR